MFRQNDALKINISLHIALKMLYWSNECLCLFLNSRQLFHHLPKLVVRQVGAMFISNKKNISEHGWVKKVHYPGPSKPVRDISGDFNFPWIEAQEMSCTS